MGYYNSSIKHSILAEDINSVYNNLQIPIDSSLRSEDVKPYDKTICDKYPFFSYPVFFM
jgi:hypothetical protein